MSKERPRLRRPSDLAREAPAKPPRRRRGPDPPAGAGGDEGADPAVAGWPEGFAAAPKDRAALLVLLSLASVTPRRLMQLAARAGPAGDCLEAVRAGEACSEHDRDLARSLAPQEVASKVREAQCRLIAIGEMEYPPSLQDLFDPPAGLFVRGRSLSELKRRVAVVGARTCSPGGKDMAGTLARDLAWAGVCVVSGGARGIDEAAHRGALAGDGETVAVLGCGVDVAYPRHNAGLFAEIARRGALVTEYPPATPAEPFRFPARNRIVAAMSEAVVVVEGAVGSGSMITAEHALDVGREVFAVPGAPWNELAATPLALIRDGATAIRSSADLLGDLGMAPPGEDAEGSGAEPALPPRDLAVWRALREPGVADRVAANSGLPLPEVLSSLALLEVRGLVLQAGGRYQRRVASRAQTAGPRPR